MSFNHELVRQQFPALDREINGQKLVYLDSAASNIKPKRVVDRISRHYLLEASNVHRGVHRLSDEATSAFEKSRSKIKNFVGASDDSEIVFVKGTTDGINLIASGLAKNLAGKESVIMLTQMEHHSNIVPWQLEFPSSKIIVAPILDNGDLDLVQTLQMIESQKPAVLSITHISNSLGTVNPIKAILQKAKSVGTITVVDGAQAVAHTSVDVKDLGCDFYVFSGHKIFGPTGIGVVYGRKSIWESMPPYQGGGAMIDRVDFEGTTFANPPHRFEAGTPHIAGVIGLGEAVDYITELGIDKIHEWENIRMNQLLDQVSKMEFVQIVGEPSVRSSILSFNLRGVHHQDVGTLLDNLGIAVRTGHHCTQPLMKRLGITGTVRASLAPFVSENDIERLIAGIAKAWEFLK